MYSPPPSPGWFAAAEADASLAWLQGAASGAEPWWPSPSLPRTVFDENVLKVTNSAVAVTAATPPPASRRVVGNRNSVLSRPLPVCPTARRGVRGKEARRDVHLRRQHDWATIARGVSD
jgi:hypothetical protein